MARRLVERVPSQPGHFGGVLFDYLTREHQLTEHPEGWRGDELTRPSCADQARVVKLHAAVVSGFPASSRMPVAPPVSVTVNRVLPVRVALGLRIH